MTTEAVATGPATPAGTPSVTSQRAIGPARAASPTMPLRMPIEVIPICTVESMRLGSSASLRAAWAELLPSIASFASRARRAVMSAISDMAKRPFATISAMSNATSMAGRGSSREDGATPAGDVEQQAEAEAERHHCGAAIGHERKGYAHDRKDTRDHAQVGEGVGEEDEGQGAGEQAREGIGRLRRDHQAATDDQQVDRQQPDGAHETELLCEHGEDEVGGALGDELQVGLRAVHPALAPGAARTDGDLRLDDV